MLAQIITKAELESLAVMITLGNAVFTYLFSKFMEYRASSSIRQRENDLEGFIQQCREEYDQKKNKILVMRDLAKTKDRYVVKFNTNDNGRKIQKTVVPDIPGDQVRGMSIKRRLSSELKRRYALEDCEVAEITHVDDYSDFTMPIPEPKQEDEINVTNTTAAILAAA